MAAREADETPHRRVGLNGCPVNGQSLEKVQALPAGQQIGNNRVQGPPIAVAAGSSPGSHRRDVAGVGPI